MFKNIHLSPENKIFLVSGVFLGFIFTFPLQLYFLSLFVLIPIISILKKSDKLDFKNFALFIVSYYLTYNIFLFDLYPMDWIFTNQRIYSLAFIIIMWILYSLACAFPQILLPSLYNFLGNIAKFRQFSFSVFVLLFVFLEYLRSYTMYFFLYSDQTLFGPHYTYGDVGYILANLPILKNIFSVLGVVGATALLLIINYIFYQIIYRKKYYYLYGLFFILFGLYFIVNDGRGVEKSLYLANVDLDSDIRSFTSIKDFTPAFRVVEDKNDLIFLPENLPVFRQKFFVEGYNIIASEYLDKKQTTYLLRDDKKDVLHEKKLLMPIGEYKLKLFNLLFPSLIDEKWAVLIGRENEYGDQGMAIMTCSELLSSELLFGGINKGGKVIIAPASLRTFNRSRNMQDKTVLYYKARAIEYGRFAIVSGNNRNSLVINQSGKVMEDFTADNNELILKKIWYKELESQTIYFKIRLFFDML